MPKDSNSQENIATEQELRGLEEALSEIASEGELDFPVTKAMEKDAETVPPEMPKRLWEGIRFRSEIRQSLKTARKAIVAENYSFTELLAAIRAEAKLSVADVARALRLHPRQLEAIEKGQTDFLKLPADTMVDLMEAFSLSVTHIEHSVKTFIARRATRSEMSSPSARTTRRAGMKDLEHALNDVAAFVTARDKTIGEANLPGGYFENIERILKRRGREDLARVR